VTDHIQQYTQTGGARPFGVALLVAGVEDGEPRLFETDPSGTPYEWQAVAIGGGREEMQSFLEEEYQAEMDLSGGVDLALEALAADAEVDAAGVNVVTVDVESGSVEPLSDDEVAAHVEELGLGGEE
jgi:proteasome alpha subunit